MNDRQMQLPITVAGVLAAFLGIAAVGLAITCFFTDSFAIGIFSLHCAVGSALFRVRSWLCVLGQRERDVYMMGVESANLHRVR